VCFNQTMSEFAESLLRNIPGLESINISDREGVEVATFSRQPIDKKHAQLISVLFALTTEQCQKLEEFGETDYLLTSFTNGHFLFQLNLHPLAVTFRGKDVEATVLIDAGNKYRQALGELRTEIAKAQE
jgi:hypothetical protein